MSQEDIARVNRIAESLDPRQSRERLALSASIYDCREHNAAIPDGATSWSRPMEDWARSCRCELSNAEAANHACPSATATPGERAMALARTVSAGSDEGTELSLAAPQNAPPPTPGAFDSLADVNAYYLDLMRRLGFSVDDVGARDDGDPTDTAQPRKGGKVRSGVQGGIYESSLGGPEEISARHPEMFTDRGAAWSGDQSQWGQRSRTLARGNNAGTAPGYQR